MEPNVVVGGQEMEGAAHERRPHDAAFVDRRGQLVRLEALEWRPEPQVGRTRLLSLHPGEPANGVDEIDCAPLEQQLPRQGRAAELASGQDGLVTGHLYTLSSVSRHLARIR